MEGGWGSPIVRTVSQTMLKHSDTQRNAKNDCAILTRGTIAFQLTGRRLSQRCTNRAVRMQNNWISDGSRGEHKLDCTPGGDIDGSRRENERRNEQVRRARQVREGMHAEKVLAGSSVPRRVAHRWRLCLSVGGDDDAKAL